MSSTTSTNYTVEWLGDEKSHCACCGNDSRRIWGLVHAPEGTVAAYWMHWTVGHVIDEGAKLDLVIGAWGDGTSPGDRYAVALVHRQQANGTPALMVVDADGYETLAGTALRRQEVIGTSLASSVFAITDAIYQQDDRFF